MIEPRALPNRTQTARRSQRWMVAALLLALLLADVVATHELLTARVPGQNDFLARWESARAYWQDGINPYSDAATARVQQQMYGRPAHDDEDPNYFAYPLYTVWLMLPLIGLPYTWAAAVWIAVLEICLVAALFMLLDLARWRPALWLLPILLFAALSHYFAARGLMLGQPGHVVYLAEVATLWGLARGRDRLAGAALAISTIKPQMGFLLVPLLLLWGLRARRWRFLAAFGVLWGALMLASFVMVPTWLGDWLAQLRNYPSYTAIGSPVWVLMVHYLGLGTTGEWALNLALWSLLVWAWWPVLARGREDRLAWAVMLTLVITHLSAVRTATPHFVVFVIPLIFMLKWVARRWGSGWAALLVAAYLVLPWAQFLATVGGSREHASMYVPVPFGLLIVLWVTRRWWWSRVTLLQTPPEQT